MCKATAQKQYKTTPKTNHEGGLGHNIASRGVHAIHQGVVGEVLLVVDGKGVLDFKVPGDGRGLQPLSARVQTQEERISCCC